MIAQPPLWFIVIAFIGAIGPLVFFHELGHYGVARLFGIGAETFSIGFGREVIGWTDRLGTRWKIGWLPVGGYVRFVGDMNPASQPDAEAELTPDQQAHAFHLHPVWQRFLVVSAGPAANFILAIVIFAAFFAIYGLPRSPNVIGSLYPGGVAQQIGLHPGDRILAIDGHATASFEDIRRDVALLGGQRVELRYAPAGTSREIIRLVTIESVEIKDEFGQPYRKGAIGILPASRDFQRLAVWQLLPEATRAVFGITRSMVQGLGQVVSGQRSTDELGGPLKMAQMAGQQASLGLPEFVQLVALFSINLGFINLLPVPMLDGGHLVFYAIEAVRRRPVSARAQDWAFRGGLALLLALILFVSSKDLASFGWLGRLGRLIG